MGARALHWFRSDLRLRDNHALVEAAAAGTDGLVCAFVFDPVLLGSPRSGAPRLRFLLDALARLDADLRERGQRLVVRHGDPQKEIPQLLREARCERLSFGRDYGPYARRRDEAVTRAAEKAGVTVASAKDRVVFESAEVQTQQGTPYKVYTPFRNRWWRRYREEPPAPPRAPRLPPPVAKLAAGALPDAAALGVAEDATEIPGAGEAAARRRLDRFLDAAVADYPRARDLPAVDGTSRLSPQFRLGTLGPRAAIDRALARAQDDQRSRAGVAKWIDELVWRDFYHAILAEHPHVLRRAFKPEFDEVRWNDDPDAFEAWCEGRTGFPIVDAGMRQLAATGWMHNRVRMIVASFLVKDLLLDWRLGERFFMERLVDGDPASNNGGWQWAASTGTDAQPYFRIFNPTSQGKRFDPEGDYVRRFVPELEGVGAKQIHQPAAGGAPPAGYPEPIVEHAGRRIEAIRRFEAAKSSG